MSRKTTTWGRAAGEGTAIGWDTEEDFGRGDGSRGEVFDCGCDRGGGGVGRVGVELRVVTCAVRPGAEEVVGHEVEEGEVLDGLSEGDVFEVPFGCGEGGG